MRPPIQRFQLAPPKRLPRWRWLTGPGPVAPGGSAAPRAAARGAALGGPARPDPAGRVPLSGADRAGRGAGRGGGRGHLVRIFHRSAGRLACAAPQTRHRTGGSHGAGPPHGPSVDQRADGDPDRRQQRGGLVRRHQLPGRNAWRGRRCRCPSWPGRCSWPVTGRSSGSTRSATTAQRSTSRSPPRTGGPATARMRRPIPASRPRRYAVDLRPSLDPNPLHRRRTPGRGTAHPKKLMSRRYRN